MKRLIKKSNNLSELFRSTLILLASEVKRLIKEEAQMCVLDPSHNIDTIVQDEKVGRLRAISTPTIEQTIFDIDYATSEELPNGAVQFRGMMLNTKEPVSVLLYPSESLGYTSMDGKSLKTHLALDLRLQRYLMDAKFDDELEFTQEQIDEMPVFLNFGKFEKRVGLSIHDEKEVYVVNQHIDEDEWICLDDFV